jgi:DNA-3-methyladenine glycosylase I
MNKGIKRSEDGQERCWWGADDGIYADYHDQEWGRPMKDDTRLFEKICLEGFQAGLSWLTILKKRDNFRKAFKGFEFEKVARFNEASVQRLLKDAGIVRHQGKIRSTINNAKRAIVLRDEFGSLSDYFWTFEPSTKERPKRMTYAALSEMTESEASRELSKDLKKRGWTFVGPTTAYAFMQAMGLVNDHLEGCHVRKVCEALRIED